MIMMEKYTYNLEGLVQERTDQLVEEKKKTEALLHRVLPKYVIPSNQNLLLNRPITQLFVCQVGSGITQTRRTR